MEWRWMPVVMCDQALLDNGLGGVLHFGAAEMNGFDWSILILLVEPMPCFSFRGHAAAVRFTFEPPRGCLSILSKTHLLPCPPSSLEWMRQCDEWRSTTRAKRHGPQQLTQRQFRWMMARTALGPTACSPTWVT